ncbi:serine/threonine-protein phosphatase 6 regulatory subunit 3-like [Cynara cardunculus var. scolymus]|uniref:serine/threonine-protein phosphatase 6 regulatory subunit 3-like n=1 Tax=Cynara cardunculus var. scolymus TaxID=59895 RepID=UPI000D62E38D|nr:serine/threonine-protein phosphatase 6 regulatory subunit 3-like [Cynara cardunculus var. scolymus]XP_024963831.1 serine/threonine-protein phosphatase 6 regulatory subunit 3-like [Cynara cardunculus var. scolymus]
MFWRMTGLSTTSPVDTILDKENFTLEELLDEDEIIQECKALNNRLINFLRERTQVEQLVRYIVEESPEDAEKGRTFKFPFIACEIFTCEVDIILKALVEDEELMNLLFSFLEPEHPHSALLAGYFSKVVVCLLLRKTVPLMNYIQAHQDIIKKLVDLIGITSIMEVLIRLIGADEHLYTSYVDSMQWLEETDVLEMIVDKFSSTDCPEVHGNAAESLCAITRYAPPGLATKISSPSFITRLFRHALEDSRPKSVLVHSLSVCISLLDPKRLTSGTYYIYNRQSTHGSVVTAKPETVEGMLESLGNLLKLLDVSSEENVLFTTYGKLQPPLGKHRLKIIEFISVLMTVSSEAAEKELIRLGALRRIIELFFEYPYNNFIHHHIEQIIDSCLESKNASLIVHILEDCHLVRKILDAEKNCALEADPKNPTIPAEGRTLPRIGNVGHMTRIANKLVEQGTHNSYIESYLQGNNEWVEWHADVLTKRNALENVYQWACGRPTTLHDRGRDSDEDDYQDRDYDVAALANNLSQAFRYGIYENDDNDEAHGSLERDDEDVYFDDESAEVVISSLRLGEDQESGSLFTNSNWFAFEEERVVHERSTDAVASPSPNTEGTAGGSAVGDDEATSNENDKNLVDTATSEVPDSKPGPDDTTFGKSADFSRPNESDKPPEWIEWRESVESSTEPAVEQSFTTAESAETSQAATGSLPNGNLEVNPQADIANDVPNKGESAPPSAATDKSEAEDDNGGKSTVGVGPPE